MPTGRPDWTAPLVPPPAEGDDVGWLVTFSDLVLQLFAFVVVAAVCGAAARHVPAAALDAAAVPAVRLASADGATAVAATSDARGASPARRAAASTDGDATGRAAALARAPAALVDASVDSRVAPAPSGTVALGALEPAAAWAGDAVPAREEGVAVEPSRDAAGDLGRAGDTAAVRDSDAPAGDRDRDAPGDRARDAPSGAGAGVGRPYAGRRVLAIGRYLGAYVAASADPQDATVVAGDGDVRLAFGGRLGFRPGSAELLPHGRRLLHEVQRLASGVPELAIEVAGYTDDVPIHTREFPSNLELSLARAARVARELQRDDPALAVRTVTLGFGEHHAVAPNDGPANRARNRRVEVRLVTRDQSMP